LKTIGKEYLDLKQLIDEFKAKEKICCKLKYNFNKQFGSFEKELSEKVSQTSELSIAIRTIDTTITNVLQKEKDNLNKSLGVIETNIANIKNTELKPVEDILEEIEPFGEKG